MSFKRKIQRKDIDPQAEKAFKLAEAAYNEGFREGFHSGRRDGVIAHAKVMEDKLITLGDVKGIGEKTFLKILYHLGYQDKKVEGNENGSIGISETRSTDAE